MRILTLILSAMALVACSPPVTLSTCDHCDAGTAAPDAGTTADAGTENPDGGGVATLTLGPDSLAPATLGTPYDATLTATGGTGPYRFAIAGAAGLPAGLSLSSDGHLSGTPSVAGSAEIAVQASDASSPPILGVRTWVLEVRPTSGTVLVFATGALAPATRGTAYEAQLVANGGTAPITFALIGGALPGGLRLESDGRILGTPVTAGSFDFVAAASDASTPAQSATATFTLDVQGSGAGTPLALATDALPAGTVGAAYAATLAAAGGTPPYSFSLAGGSSLPAGLSLAQTGEISGTPTAPGTANVSVQVTDSSSPPQLAGASLILAILPAAGGEPLAISTTALPVGRIGEAYAATLTATGGTAPYVFSLGSGSTLPAGILISDAGALTGTPTAAGTFALAVQVTDASVPPQLATRTIALGVLPASGAGLVFTTAALPDAKVGVPYDAEVTAAGGTTPYRFAVSGLGALPAGLFLDTTGHLRGTPLAAGRASFALSVSDASTPTQSTVNTFNLTVLSDVAGATLAITTSALPNAKVGTAYRQQLGATGGNGTDTWRLVAGSLPAGFTLDGAGVLSGTPASQGSYAFTAEVTDSSQPPQSALVSLVLAVVAPASAGLTLTSTSFPDGQVGLEYKQPLHAVGGTAPYAFSIDAGALPPGLSLEVTTHGAQQTVLQGTPTVAGTFRFTVKVTDGAGATALKPLQLNVLPDPAGPQLTTPAIPDGQVNRPYSVLLGATGGTGPYTFSLATGTTLPAGLVLTPDGTLSGTPTAAGASAFVVSIVDAAGHTAAAQLWLNVIP